MLEINPVKQRAFCMSRICVIRPGEMTSFVAYTWHTFCAIASNVTYIRGIRPVGVNSCSCALVMHTCQFILQICARQGKQVTITCERNIFSKN